MTTPAPLTPQQLDEIETRAQAATKGPWTTDGWEIYQGAEQDSPNLLTWVGETCRADDYDGSRRDAEFIAHARTDVPALLDEVRRLNADLAEYEVLNPQQCPAGKHADWLVDSENTHACPWCEIDRLKGAAEETHVVADDSDDPEHIDDCPGCDTTDTLPAWLAQRFDPRGADWEQLGDDDRAYWEHQARAVRRAVARGGFKAPAAPAP